MTDQSLNIHSGHVQMFQFLNTILHISSITFHLILQSYLTADVKKDLPLAKFHRCLKEFFINKANLNIRDSNFEL